VSRVAAEAPPPAAVAPPSAVRPMWLRVLGGVLVGVAAVQSALLEVFYVPLRAGTVILPVSALAAVVLNVLLPRLMYRATQVRRATVVPAALWLVVVVGLAMGRPEGDVVLPGSSNAIGVVALVVLFGGAAAAAFGVARAMPPLPARR
jgi:uncharacterized protein DUF6113